MNLHLGPSVSVVFSTPLNPVRRLNQSKDVSSVESFRCHTGGSPSVRRLFCGPDIGQDLDSR